MFERRSYVIGRWQLSSISLLIGVACLFVSLFYTKAVNAQSSPRISIHVKNKTIIHVLKLINEKTGISFFYNIEELKKLPPVTLDISGETVDNILQLLLKDKPLHAQHTNGLIAITPDNANAPLSAVKEVTGVITDKDGYPLQQANIVEQGTLNGSRSDHEGHFRLKVNAAAVLQVSYLGMQPLLVPVKQAGPLLIKMSPISTYISEVIVNGYTAVKHKYSAAAVTSISGTNLDRADQLTVDNMLQGKVPGLNINLNSTIPGAAPKIRLRGTATLLGNREPVWVIDGIISDPPMKLDAATINSLDNVNLMSSAVIGLNPKDIERIDVLKDAAAAALYGVNGGNGVIVITTKKGAFNKTPQVSLSQMANITFRPTYRHLNLMDAAQRIALSKEAIDNKLLFSNSILPRGFERDYIAYRNGEMSEAAFNKLEQGYKSMNTDWFNILFNNGVSQRYNLSVNGGSSQTAYYLSMGYSSQKGPAIFTKANQYSGMLRIDHRFTSRFQTGIKLSGSQQEGSYPYQTDPYEYAYYTARSLPFTVNNQRLYYNPSPVTPNRGIPNYTLDTAQLANFNILSEMENSGQRTTVNTYNAVINADWTLLRSLKVHGLYGFGHSRSLNSSYAGERTYYMANYYRLGLAPGMPYTNDAQQNIIQPDGGEYKETVTGQRNYTIRHSLEYSTTRGSHFIQVVAGNELRQSKYDISKLMLLGYYPDRGKISHPPPANKYPFYNTFFAYPGNDSTDHINKKYRQLSWYATLVYAYKDRYTFNFNMRQDAANSFAQSSNNAYQKTWSAAFKWSISDEPWLQNQLRRSMLALRLSYGYNNGIPDLDPPHLTISNATTDLFSGEDQAVVRNFANPALRWEKTYTFNGGVDFSFFNGRLYGTVDAYRKQSADLLASINLAEENGVNSFILNSAGLLNYGFETSLQWQAIKSKNWQWNVGSNLSLSYTKVLQTNFTDPGIIGNQQQYLDGNIIRSGTDPNTMYAFKFKGLNNQGLPDFRGIYDADYTNQPTAGEYFVNVFVPTGRRIPTLDGSFFTKVSYCNWSISAVFLVKLGYKQRLVNLYGNAGFVPNPAENVSAEVEKRWKQAGDEQYTNIPALANQQAFFVFDPVTMAPIQYFRFDTYTQQYLLQQAPLYLMSTQPWIMYNNSDIRTVNAGHMRLSTVSLQYTMRMDKSKKSLFKGMSCYLQAHDLLLITNKKLYGQDPELPAGAMPRQPSLTIGADITF